MHVEAGWEDAVEAVLRERISALIAEVADPAWGKDRPGSKLTLLLPMEQPVEGDAPGFGADHLLSHIRCDDPKLAAVLGDWLGDVHAASDLASALAFRESLCGSACCVTPGGDVVSRQSVTLFAPDAAEHGLLERQREIEELGDLIAQREERVEQEHARLAEIEERMVDAQNALQDSRKHLDNLQEQAHAIQCEAESLLDGAEHEPDSRHVLELVRGSDCSAYDCEFIALAETLGTRLSTMDGKLLKAFPKLALPLAAG